MTKLTQNLLERYFDGELKPKKVRQVERLLEESPEHQESLSELTKIGDLLRLMNEESLTDVSFEGFKTQIDRQIRTEEQRPSLLLRAKVWAAEFFDHRRVVWVPAAATVGALVLALVLLPTGPNSTPIGAPDDGIQLYNSHTPLISRIDSVDFGDLTGTQYVIDDDQGGKVGVVWINERL